MDHYICTGGCGGVAGTAGACQASDCGDHGKDLQLCDCKDGSHGKESVSSEDTDV